MKNKTYITKFDNSRPPLRTVNEPEFIRLGDGGQYRGIGFYTFDYVKTKDNKTVHCWTEYSSGCDYGNGCRKDVNYLGSFKTGDFNRVMTLLKPLDDKSANVVIEFLHEEGFIEIPVS